MLIYASRSKTKFINFHIFPFFSGTIHFTELSFERSEKNATVMLSCLIWKIDIKQTENDKKKFRLQTLK